MPTTNPVPSNDPIDLLFNAQKLDEVVSGSSSYYTDRLGVNRRTVEGINAAADVVLGGIGYAPPVAYAAGISMTLTTQTVEYSGEIYAPKVASLPFTTSTWATDSAKFRLIQGVAATDLAASGGAGMIGYIPEGAGAVATTVQAKLSSLELADYAALRAFTGTETHVQIIANGISGEFRYDQTDTASIDNGGTVIVGADGRRWKRLFSGAANALWFGVQAGDLSAGAYTLASQIARTCAAFGIVLAYPSGRFASPGVFVPTDPINNLKIVGVGRPSLNADATMLDGATGTVFVGPIQVTGDSITFADFGVDVGPTTGSANNGLIINGRIGTTRSASVRDCSVKRISVLSFSPSAAIHGVLLQGIDGLELDEISTTSGLYGTVIKCQNVTAGTLRSASNGAVGVYVKSDTGAIGGDTYSTSDNVTIGQVIYEASLTDTASVACEVFASTADTKCVNIGSVNSIGGGYALHLRGNSGIANARGTTVGSVNGRNTYQDVLIGENTNGTAIGRISTQSPRRGIIFESAANTVDCTVDSIVGVVSGVKAIPNLDVVLRGETSVGIINITSDNTRPTVSVENTVINRIGSMTGVTPQYDGALTLINGYESYFEIPTVRAGSDGWRLSGRLDVGSATSNSIATLPSSLYVNEATLIPVACLEGGVYAITWIYIAGTDLQWINRTAQPSVTWIDLSSVYVRFGQ